MITELGFVISRRCAVPWAKSDGGKSVAGFAERSDCTVRAMAILSEKSYSEVHAVMAEHGRVERKGFAFTCRAERIARDLGLDLSPAKCVYGKTTVEWLIKLNPTGKMIVAIRGHVFAVVEGVVHDSGEAAGRAKVTDAWIAVPSERGHSPRTLFS